MTIHKRKLSLLLMLAISAIMWQACLKSDLTNIDGVQLTPTLAIPLVKANFSFQDFIKSDSLIKTAADGTVQIVYAQDNIASYSTADIVSQATGSIAATTSKNIAMGDLTIPGFALDKSTTLSSFSTSFNEPLKTLFAVGGTTPPTGIPAFTQNTSSQSDMSDLTEFQDISLASGTLALTATNNFPFSLQNLKVDLVDRGRGNALIATIDMGNLGSGATKTVNTDLANKSFTNKLGYKINSLSCAGIAANTMILPTATIAVRAAGVNMKIKSGTVKLTAQNLAPENIIAPVTTGNPDHKLYEVNIKSATASYTITKSIPANFTMELTFPTIKENGVAVKKTVNVTGNSVSGSIAFNNAVADLTTIAAQPYNQLPVIASVVVQPTTGFVTIGSTDFIAVSSQFSNVAVDGAKGQFGTFTVNIPKKNLDFAFDFSFLSKTSKQLFFDNPIIKMRYNNSFGIPISANMNINASGLLGSAEALNAPAITIGAPKIAQIGQTLKDSFSINKTNSRIVPFLSILPNKINYDGTVQIKSNATDINFFTANSKMDFGVDFVLPLKFSTENLILRDTVKGELSSENRDKFETATLIINHINGFPLKTSLDIIGLDGTIETPIVQNFSIPSATVDANGKVTQANTGKQTLAVTNAQLQLLLAAKKLIIVAKVQTANGGTAPVAMLPSYNFEVAVGMEAKLKVRLD